jgi:hypothetical protein
MKHIVATLALVSLPLLAQKNAIPRMPDGHPDFQGVWQHPYVPDMSQNRENQKGAGPLPFTAAGADNSPYPKCSCSAPRRD